MRGLAEEIEVHLPHERKTSDDEIASRALRILAWSAAVPDDAITVKAEKGWITLSGFVDWQFQRNAAERAARRLSGIKGVSNLVSVKPQVQPSDVRHRIEEALHPDAALDAAHITINVDSGRVVLGSVTGLADWSFRR